MPKVMHPDDTCAQLELFVDSHSSDVQTETVDLHLPTTRPNLRLVVNISEYQRSRINRSIAFSTVEARLIERTKFF